MYYATTLRHPSCPRRVYGKGQRFRRERARAAPAVTVNSKFTFVSFLEALLSTETHQS